MKLDLSCAAVGATLFVAVAGCPAPASVPQKSAAVQPASSGAGYVWIEAEKPDATNFPPAAQNPFAPANPTEADVLSGGQWIGVGSDRPGPLFAEYKVTIPAGGNYSLYARKFWQHGPFRWRIDDGPWQSVGKNVALLDDAPMRKFTGANWVAAGGTTLTPGAHTLRVELTENTGAAAFDVFLLTSRPFVARGKMKPGEKYNRAPQGWFAWEADLDPFRPTPMDLRGLNEKFAGENGFITAKGESFVHGKTGAPVRFWAVNTGAQTVQLDDASQDYMARTLAKQGVNLIRVHGGVWGTDYRKADPAFINRYQRFVSAMKKQGIYTCLSIYFPLWLNFDEKSGFEGYAGGKHPFSLLFFSPEFQAIYRGWWRSLLTTPNPYENGVPLGKDPAVAMAEMVNEDSHLFWTFTPYQNIPGPQMAVLEKQFGDWLATKYGTLDKAFAAWGTSASVRGDDKAAGRVGFLPLDQVRQGQNSPRARDTAVFLTENMKQFYQETYTFLKNDLGFQGSIQGSNWITADTRVLGPLDKYANTVADYMDHHGYFGGPHTGERASYSISVGDRYDDRSALLFSPEKAGGPPAFGLPIMDLRYNNKPSALSEVNWTPPNRYRADFPVVAAAYGALQGTDALFFFATASPAWEQSLGKFSIRTPVTGGQFPAAAYLYRKGLVKDGPPVVSVNLGMVDLMALKGAPVSGPLNLDELRANDIPAGGTAAVSQVSALDPLSFLVGKVGIDFSATGGPSRVADLGRFIDRDKKVVRSATGELAWNWGGGRVVVNAPGAQGVTGFLGQAGAVALRDVTVESPLEYGSVLLVALDDKPVAQSARMLLQVMSEEQNYGWDAPGTGLREIKSIGGPPIVVKELAGTVRLKRPDAARLTVTALDPNGYPVRKLTGGAAAITLNPRTVYYLIERK